MFECRPALAAVLHCIESVVESTFKLCIREIPSPLDIRYGTHKVSGFGGASFLWHFCIVLCHHRTLLVAALCTRSGVRWHWLEQPSLVQESADSMQTDHLRWCKATLFRWVNGSNSNEKSTVIHFDLLIRCREGRSLLFFGVCPIREGGGVTRLRKMDGGGGGKGQEDGYKTL